MSLYKKPISSKNCILLKKLAMTIERTNGEIIIRISDSIDTLGIQRIIDFLNYKEATQSSKAKQEDVDKLSSEINKSWWKTNEERFLK